MARAGCRDRLVTCEAVWPLVAGEHLLSTFTSQTVTAGRPGKYRNRLADPALAAGTEYEVGWRHLPAVTTAQPFANSMVKEPKEKAQSK